MIGASPTGKAFAPIPAVVVVVVYFRVRLPGHTGDIPAAGAPGRVLLSRQHMPVFGHVLQGNMFPGPLGGPGVLPPNPPSLLGPNFRIPATGGLPPPPSLLNNDEM